MSGQALGVTSVDPMSAYQTLSSGSSAALVDVRTRAEWTFVGVPDIDATGRPLWLIEWVGFPPTAPNPDFAQTLRKHCGADVPERIFFICRSGQRSLHAAHAVAEAFTAEGLTVECINVAEGFEGDLDASGRRGGATGWKARGLPWRQS